LDAALVASQLDLGMALLHQDRSPPNLYFKLCFNCPPFDKAIEFRGCGRVKEGEIGLRPGARTSISVRANAPALAKRFALTPRMELPRKTEIPVFSRQDV